MKNKTFKWIYLIGFFLILALPLLNVPPWFSPPDWGKTVVFRTILSILLFIFLWQILLGKKISFKISSAFAPSSGGVLGRRAMWLLIALAGTFFLSTVFSSNPYFSFWGSPYRAGGSLNFVFYIIFAILAFFILRKSGWRKIWDFSLIIGILVSIVAVLQFFQVLGQTLIPYERNPPSTLGNSTFLAIYLLLLSFLALSFGLKEKNRVKKVFYFSSIILFLFVILTTEARAAYLGLAVGLLYFFVLYPKRILWLKLLAVIFLISIISIVYYINTRPELPEFIENNRILKTIASRLSIKLVLTEERFPAWKVSLEAIGERLIFGWGPENYSIAFDKHYDPSLPHFANITWWDRAHNFIFDIGVTTGIPALIIYLSLFSILFWQLQKIKNQYKSVKISGNQCPIIYHGIQAAFLAYLTANFFSFDCFSTYLISFLLISYSLHLISGVGERNKNNPKDISRMIPWGLRKYKGILLFSLFILLVWFIWNFNIKPFLINKEINWAIHYSKNGECKKALAKIENILPSHSIIDHYLRLRYVDIIRGCITKMPEGKLVLAQKATQILKENTKIRPYYTRNWLLLGSHTNILLANSKDPQIMERLKNEANTYFERANQLSPRRQEVFINWSQTYIYVDEYKIAKEKAQKCIDLNPERAKCWWLMSLAQIGLGETEEAKKNMDMAGEKGYPIDAKKSLLQLAEAYGDVKNYKPLVRIYQGLISFEPNNFQYHASLAYVYKMLGDYEKARSEALIVLKLSPESKETVEEFLRTLP